MSQSIYGNTIFMTPEETERIRKTVNGRLQKCQELLGQSRTPGDVKARSQQVATAALLSDIAGTTEPGLSGRQRRSDALVAFAVGCPYAPCTAPVQDLQPMKLSDLHLETHHRGRALTLKRVAPVVRLVAYSWTVVQDESSDEIERLEVFLHKSKHDEEILETGTTFTIKEPYFTINDQGEPTLRIDHPSDLLVSTDIPGDGTPVATDQDSATTPATCVAKTAKECKDEGNAALKRQDLLRAHVNYTEGLRLVKNSDTEKTDLANDLFRNSAYVSLLLDRLDEAETNALASLTGMDDQKHKDLDGKAYFRAGCAAYNQGDFSKAESFFVKQQGLTPSDRDAVLYLRKTRLRLSEQATGVFDWKKIEAGLSQTRPRVDVASFTCNTEIRESPGRGRGLFATRDIEPGQLIMCEKAFCVVWGHEIGAWTAMTCDVRDNLIRAFPAGLYKAIIQKLLNNPSQIGKVMDLYGDYPGIGKQTIMADNSPVIDTFQVHDIVARNAFGPGPVQSGDEDITNASTGLWIWAAYINHSCLPNTRKEYVGDLLAVYATRPIRAGEEITHSYTESDDYDARIAKVSTTWGFTCTCPLCIAEKADGPTLRKKRLELIGQATAFVEKEDPAQARRVSILKAKRLARAIEDTYDEERYSGVPRTALSGIQNWLGKVRTW